MPLGHSPRYRSIRAVRAFAGALVGGVSRVRGAGRSSAKAAATGPFTGKTSAAKSLRERSGAVTQGWTIVVALHQALQHRKATLKHVGRGKVVIFDRYALDSAAQLRYFYGSQNAFRVQKWLIDRISPTPRRSYLLEVPPPVVAARKELQYSLEGVYEQAALLVEEGPGWAWSGSTASARARRSPSRSLASSGRRALDDNLGDEDRRSLERGPRVGARGALGPLRRGPAVAARRAAGRPAHRRELRALPDLQAAPPDGAAWGSARAASQAVHDHDTHKKAVRVAKTLLAGGLRSGLGRRLVRRGVTVSVAGDTPAGALPGLLLKEHLREVMGRRDLEAAVKFNALPPPTASPPSSS